MNTKIDWLPSLIYREESLFRRDREASLTQRFLNKHASVFMTDPAAWQGIWSKKCPHREEKGLISVERNFCYVWGQIQMPKLLLNISFTTSESVMWSTLDDEIYLIYIRPLWVLYLWHFRTQIHENSVCWRPSRRITARFKYWCPVRAGRPHLAFLAGSQKRSGMCLKLADTVLIVL